MRIRSFAASRHAFAALFLLFVALPMMGTRLPGSGIQAQARGSAAFEANFPPGSEMRAVTEPFGFGLEEFGARLASLRESGKEPLGLVLAGGSARAYAHIGVLQALEAAGIRPDFIVANSMGGVIGMLYAAGLHPDTIAELVCALPPEYYLDLVLPTKGGLINTQRFVAAIKEVVGDIDLSQAKIPIIVTAEDLKTRRQVRLAAGPFSTVMATTFAIPAIFEPVPLGEWLLVDGGLTNVVPADIATEYSSSLIVSTALYDRAMSFGNPVSVLNRSVDIAKTRAGLEALEVARPLVIRNRVEGISYMQFAQPRGIIELGRESAEAVMASILDAFGERAENEPCENLKAARASYAASMPLAIARLGRGGMPSVEPTSRYKLYFSLLDSFGASPLDIGKTYAGFSALTQARRVRSSLSAIFSLDSQGDKAWGLVLDVVANPVDSLKAQFQFRLWGDFGEWADYAVDPESVEALGLVSWSTKGRAVAFAPRIFGSITRVQDSGAVEARASGGLSLEWKTGPSGGWDPSGFAAFISAQADAFMRYSASGTAWGPEADLRVGMGYRGIAGLRLRAKGRADLG
ncbi:MAG TPA: patatin-like phospholipase family protein, partial [Rectinemataceae bacterium]